MNQINEMLENSNIVNVTVDGLIQAFLKEGQKLAMDSNAIEDIKNIKFEIKSFKKDGTIPEMQAHFFKDNQRSIDPKKNDHNLPIGVIQCLRHMVPKVDYWFKLHPKYQNNPTIQGYPVEAEDLFFNLKILMITKNKKLDPIDIMSYLNAIVAFKEEGNEFYSLKNYDKAVALYVKGVKLVPAIPKKLAEKSKLEMPDTWKTINTLLIQLQNNLAISYHKLKEYDKGIDCAHKALRMDPENVKAKYRLAKNLEESKNYEEAIKFYEEIGLHNQVQSIKLKKEKLENNLKKKIIQSFATLNE